MPDYSHLSANEIYNLYKQQDVSNMEISKIKLDLEQGNVAKEDIQIVLNAIDNLKYSIENKKLNKKQGQQLITAGYFALGLGLLITLGTYISAVNKGGGVYALMYGPMALGIGLIMQGFSKKH